MSEWIVVIISRQWISKGQHHNWTLCIHQIVSWCKYADSVWFKSFGFDM